ncbi:MAG: transcriptional regulator, TetR family [Paenibacillaceae bacterium]|nr:transcriptional regulator, TetR family [Paenibacillaceae bacterium]
MARDEQKQRSDKVRQAILETALNMGIREGFEAVSVRKIIQEMNYSTGVLYHHFKDKQEIIDAIEERETAWLHGEIRSLLDENRDFIWNMRRVFGRMLRLAWEEAEKYNLIVLHKYSRHQGAGQPEWIGYMAARLEEGMEGGLIRRMNPTQAAFVLWSSFLGFNLMISRRPGDMGLAEAEELLAVQMEMVLKGILNMPSGTDEEKEEL